MIFGITAYGLAAVAVLSALYSLTVFDRQTSPWSVTFIGTAAAVTVPAHLIVARSWDSSASAVSRSSGSASRSRRRDVCRPCRPCGDERSWLTAIVIVATVVWGLSTATALPIAGLRRTCRPLALSGANAVVVTALGAGAFLSILVAWFVIRADRRSKSTYTSVRLRSWSSAQSSGARDCPICLRPTCSLLGSRSSRRPLPPLPCGRSGADCEPPDTCGSPSPCWSYAARRWSSASRWGSFDCSRSDRRGTSPCRRRFSQQSGHSHRTQSLPTHACLPRRSPSGKPDSSALTHTPDDASFRCASRLK